MFGGTGTGKGTWAAAVICSQSFVLFPFYFFVTIKFEWTDVELNCFATLPAGGSASLVNGISGKGREWGGCRFHPISSKSVWPRIHSLFFK